MVEPRILKNFFVIEGIDGAGTTTQLKRIDAAFSGLGVPCWTTCEPTTTPTGRLIRQVLSGELLVRPETLARLFVADRYEHVHGEGNGILAHLERGEVVVSDRYLFSSLAYQSIECGFDAVFSLNAAFPLPEILIYIEVPVEIGEKRFAARESREIFENADFQAKVLTMYGKAIETYADFGMEILTVDGTGAEDQVFEKLWSRIRR